MPYKPVNYAAISAAANQNSGARLQNAMLAQGVREAFDPTSVTNRLREAQLAAALRPPLHNVAPGGALIMQGKDGFEVAHSQPATRTGLEKNAIAIGLVPGTEEYNKFIRRASIRDNWQYETTQQPETEGVEETAPQDLATMFGVTTPWANIQNPAEAEKLKTKSILDAQKTVRDLQAAVKQNAGLDKDIDRFLFLNKKVETGGARAIPLIGDIYGAGRKAVDPLWAEMESLTDKTTPKMRQGLPGAASERDTAMFRSAAFGTQYARETNENIAKAMKTAYQNSKDYADFYSWYVTTYQHDLGANDIWNAYIEANPIFDPTAQEGSYTLNDSRVPWRKWMENPRAQAQKRVKVKF